jgi:ATP-dependent helicase YprA (DUF1998 family)
VTALYPYQRRVYDALVMRGKNVILQAPTGAGKSRAALDPYFHNLARSAERDYPAGAPLPLTCRYAVRSTYLKGALKGHRPQAHERCPDVPTRC